MQKRPWTYAECDRCGNRVLLVKCRSKRPMMTYFCKACSIRVFIYKIPAGMKFRNIVYR